MTNNSPHLEVQKQKKVYFQEIILLQRFFKKDIEFLTANKIYSLIDCNKKDHAQTPPIKKFSYYDLGWNKNDSKTVLKLFTEILPKIQPIFEKAEKQDQSVLVFCDNGQNRSLCIIVCYLMQRFNWSFYKSLEYLDNKRPNLEIKKNFFENLKITTKNFEIKNKVSTNWLDQFYSSEQKQYEELLLRNTFLNASKQFIQKDFYKFHNSSNFGRKRFFKTSESFSAQKKSLLHTRSRNKQIQSLGRKTKVQKKKIRWADRMAKKSLKKTLQQNRSFNIANKKKDKSFKNKNESEIKKQKQQAIYKKFLDVKKLEEHLKKHIANSQNSDANLKQQGDDITSSTEFHKKNLEILQQKIYRKTKNKEMEPNSVSTKIQEESFPENNFKRAIVYTEGNNSNSIKNNQISDRNLLDQDFLDKIDIKQKVPTFLKKEKQQFQKIFKPEYSLFDENFKQKLCQLEKHKKSKSFKNDITKKFEKFLKRKNQQSQTRRTGSFNREENHKRKGTKLQDIFAQTKLYRNHNKNYKKTLQIFQNGLTNFSSNNSNNRKDFPKQQSNYLISTKNKKPTFQRPNSAPAKDKKKARLIQKQLLFDGNLKNFMNKNQNSMKNAIFQTKKNKKVRLLNQCIQLIFVKFILSNSKIYKNKFLLFYIQHSNFYLLKPYIHQT